MSGPRVIQALEEMTKAETYVNNKKLEIVKRREVLTAQRNSETEKAKQEAKQQKIDLKIIIAKNGMISSTAYFRTQIETAMAKREREVANAKAKMETTIAAAQAKCEREIEAFNQACEKYVKYNQDMINNEEQKLDKAIKEIEKEKVNIGPEDLDEEADKTMTRLKVEAEQLNEKYESAKKYYFLCCEEHENAMKQRQAEAIQQLREKQQILMNEEREKAMVAYQLRKEQEEREDEERKQRNKERLEKERLQKEAKEREKATRTRVFTKFKKEHYPHLSPDATGVYNWLKKEDVSIFPAYKEAQEKESLEDCEGFLMNLKPDVDLCIVFEKTQLKKLTIEEQALYDLLSFEDKVKAVKLKDRQKRKEFLLKFKIAPEVESDDS